MGVHLGWQVSVLPQKRGFILNWKVSVLSRKRGCRWAEKSVFCHKKGVIFKLENKDGYQFFQWVREPGLLPAITSSHNGFDAIIYSFTLTDNQWICLYCRIAFSCLLMNRCQNMSLHSCNVPWKQYLSFYMCSSLWRFT